MLSVYRVGRVHLNYLRYRGSGFFACWRAPVFLEKRMEPPCPEYLSHTGVMLISGVVLMRQTEIPLAW